MENHCLTPIAKSHCNLQILGIAEPADTRVVRTERLKAVHTNDLQCRAMQTLGSVLRIYLQKSKSLEYTHTHSHG